MAVEHSQKWCRAWTHRRANGKESSIVGIARHPADCRSSPYPMPKLTAKDLAEHVTQLEQASIEELDELLTDLLVQVYPTKVTQDS